MPSRRAVGLKEPTMDLVCLAITAAFFALSWGFIELCDRL
jgi:hypothetical protein